MSELRVGDETYEIFRIADAGSGVEGLPFSLKILLENLLRHGLTEEAARLAAWDPSSATASDDELSFSPARVLMQDFTGVPCIVDLAAMRDAVIELGGDPAKVNPLIPAELVIDHSVQVDVAG